jgi:hypothetical protein
VVGVHEAGGGEGKEAEIAASGLEVDSPDFVLIVVLQLDDFLLAVGPLDDAAVLVVEEELVVQVYLVEGLHARLDSACD